MSFAGCERNEPESVLVQCSSSELVSLVQCYLSGVNLMTDNSYLVDSLTSELDANKYYLILIVSNIDSSIVAFIVTGFTVFDAINASYT